MLFFILLLHFSIMNVTGAYAQDNKTMNIVCYYLSGYGIRIAPPETLDPNLCTHLNYAFINLDINGNLTHQNKNVDITKGMYRRVMSWKDVNPKIKIIASVSATMNIFSEVAANVTKRHIFVNSSVDFCKTHGFDGIDIDWEKPNKEDADNFVELLKELKTELDKKELLLTVAVFPFPSVGYNVPEIAKYVHMIHLMCYNFYGSWSSYTGFNSALFKSPAESDYEQNHLNIAASIKNWIDAGAPREKINVGIPFYGHTFTLANPDDHGLHSPITGAGDPKAPSYGITCSKFENYTTVWDDTQKVPYKYYGNQWLTYEDERSIEEKTKYIASQNVGGIMIWQIGLDDVNGNCGPKQGLLRVVNKYLYNNSDKKINNTQ